LSDTPTVTAYCQPLYLTISIIAK